MTPSSRMLGSVAVAIGAAGLVAGLLAPAEAQAPAPPKKFRYDQKLIADPPSGPPPLKKRLAVSRFDDSTTVEDSPFGVLDPVTMKKHQNDDINSLLSKDLAVIRAGFTERLVTALFATDRFIVLERRDVHKVLREQDFAKSDRVARSAALAQGEMLSAQYIVAGVITLDHGEGADRTSDSEVQMSLAVPGSRTRVTVGTGRAVPTDPGAAAGQTESEGPVAGDRSLLDKDQPFECPRDPRVRHRYALHMRVYDVSTSQVVSAVRVSADNQWCLIKGGVSRIVVQMEKFPWKTRVAAVEGERVVVEGGRDVNMTHGHRLLHQATVGAATGAARYAKAPTELSIIEVHDVASVATQVAATGGSVPADIRQGDWVVFNPGDGGAPR